MGIADLSKNKNNYKKMIIKSSHKYTYIYLIYFLLVFFFIIGIFSILFL